MEKKVRCVETGVILKSVAYAAETAGVTRKTMANHCNNGKELNGRHFEFVDEKFKPLKMFFNLDNYIEFKNVAMHVKTKEEYEIFSKYLTDNGRTLCSGEKYNYKDIWKTYKEETCIGFKVEDSTYGSQKFYKKYGYTILEFDSFLWDEEDYNPVASEIVEAFYIGGKSSGPKIYVSPTNDILYPYYCVQEGFEQKYKEGKPYDKSKWSKVKRLNGEIAPIQEVKSIRRTFNLNDYQGKCVMHFENKQEFDTLCKFMHKSGFVWDSGESYLNSRYPDEGFRYPSENVNCIAFNEGYKIKKGDALDFNYTILEFSDFDWTDKPIIEIKTTDCTDREKCESYAKQAKAYEEKVEEWHPLKGKRYEVSNYSCFTDSKERIFWEENKEFEKPYSCVHCGFEEGYERGLSLLTMSYKYIREIKPKYEAYTEFDPKWIGEDICYDGDYIRWIVGFHCKGVLIYTEDEGYSVLPFEEFIKYTWEKTGKPCGKEITCKN